MDHFVLFIRPHSLQGKLAQLLPLEMQSQEHYVGCTSSNLGCTVTVHHAQLLRIMGETQVKTECLAPQLAEFEQVFSTVI